MTVIELNTFGRVQNHLAYQYSRKGHRIHWEWFHIASGQWPKTPGQFSQGVYQGREVESIRLPKSISRFKSDWTWISPAEEESKERNSPKQETIGVGCIKVWESIQRMRSRVWWCLCVTDSLLWLCARDLQLNNSFSSFISALCSTVPILMLTSDSGMNSKSAVLFIW